MKRTFLQHAKTYRPTKDKIAGWWLSEKLDGSRCFWDGGVSRDKPTHTIPWANLLDPKTGEPKKKVKPVATGLWSRLGNPIIAPDWFLNLLPACPLDGELFAGRGNFQLCRSIVSGDAPDERWDQIDYAVYGSPSIQDVFCTGELNDNGFKGEMDYDACLQFIQENALEGAIYPDASKHNFKAELAFVTSAIEEAGDRVYVHHQTQLPSDEAEAVEVLERRLKEVLDQRGEGLMLRKPDSFWRPKRVSTLLKYKPFEDDEAVITGFVGGHYGKQGTVHGKIGALVVDYKGKPFELGSGLKLHERELFPQDVELAKQCEGKPIGIVETPHFKIGDLVTFKYREFTDDGIPKEGRFWRKRV